MKVDCLIVGSGAGGSVTAAAYAGRGRSVLVLEEGQPNRLPVPFSVEEMEQSYRNGGQTATFGQPRVIYVEASVVGGGSEVNSGLYHRTPNQVLLHWARHYQLEAASSERLAEHFARVEEDLSIGVSAYPPPPAGLKLLHGAQTMGWSCQDVPRWYTPESRRTMSTTYLARARQDGAELRPGWRAQRLRRQDEGWQVLARGPGGQKASFEAARVYLCGGAVQTPLLMLRSGITHCVGRSLALHPTVKVLARFPETVNSLDMGVPAFQVRHFAPEYCFGCSVSSPGYLATGLIDYPEALASLPRQWPQMGSYYCMIEGDSRGRVLAPPLFEEPVVLYPLSDSDLTRLAEGLKQLCRLLFAAGAVGLYPSLSKSAPLRSLAEVEALPSRLPRQRVQLMTIHLFSSCPMGEQRQRTATDSYGRVWDAPGLYVNDASLLCSAPGVNPQGSVMGFAWRNALQHLESRQP